LVEIPESPWGEYGYRHEHITPRQLARLLHEYNIRSSNLRYCGQVVKGYKLEDFQETFDRYIPENNRDNATTPGNESDDVADIGGASATIDI